MGRNKFFVLLSLVFIFSFSFVFAYTGKIMTGDVGAEVDPGIKVSYDTFRGEGETTDFLYLTDEELSNVGSLTLERVDYGRLILDGMTNLTDDVINNSVDLSNNVVIMDKFIFVNSTVLKSFQKSGLMTFRNVYFDDPFVLKNGEDCSDCNEVSYVDNVYVFGFSNFSSYEVIENPYSTEDPDEGGGSDSDEDDDSSSSSSGGGGGGGSDDFSDEIIVSDEIFDSLIVSDDVISVDVKRGSYFSRKIWVRNNGTRSISLGVLVENLTKFAFPSERSFELSPGEIKTMTVDFYFPRSQETGVYVGGISFISQSVKKTIDTILNVNNQKSLFDVFIEVDKDEYSPTDEVSGNVSIYNLGESSVSANVYYAIKNMDDEILVSDSKDIIVKDSVESSVNLKLPMKATSGNYVFYVFVTYDGGHSVASTNFYVSSNWFYDFLSSKSELGIALAAFLLFVLVGLIWMIVRYKRAGSSDSN